LQLLLAALNEGILVDGAASLPLICLLGRLGHWCLAEWCLHAAHRDALPLRELAALAVAQGPADDELDPNVAALVQQLRTAVETAPAPRHAGRSLSHRRVSRQSCIATDTDC
jgi:hypothetical protein